MDPAHLSPEELTRLLNEAGPTQVDRAMIDADLEAGAPRNEDGTMNLACYAAWLLAEGRQPD